MKGKGKAPIQQHRPGSQQGDENHDEGLEASDDDYMYFSEPDITRHSPAKYMYLKRKHEYYDQKVRTEQYEQARELQMYYDQRNEIRQKGANSTSSTIAHGSYPQDSRQPLLQPRGMSLQQAQRTLPPLCDGSSHCTRPGCSFRTDLLGAQLSMYPPQTRKLFAQSPDDASFAQPTVPLSAFRDPSELDLHQDFEISSNTADAETVNYNQPGINISTRSKASAESTFPAPRGGCNTTAGRTLTEELPEEEDIYGVSPPSK